MYPKIFKRHWKILSKCLQGIETIFAFLLNYKLAHQAILSSIPGSLFLSVTLSLNSGNSAAVFSCLFASLVTSSPHWPRIYAQGPTHPRTVRYEYKKIVKQSKVHLFLAKCGPRITWKVKVHSFFRIVLREVRPCFVGDFNKTIIPLVLVGQTWL